MEFSADGVRRAIGAAVSIAALTGLSGCVVGDIRDSLVEVNESLARTNAKLDLVVAELGLRLEPMMSVDESLVSIDDQLDDVETSLERLDDHLASLRRTLQSIDKTIPFLKLADDEPVEERPADGQSAAPVNELPTNPPPK